MPKFHAYAKRWTLFRVGRAGRNDFEGLKSYREYALLAKGEIFAELARIRWPWPLPNMTWAKAAFYQLFWPLKPTRARPCSHGIAMTTIAAWHGRVRLFNSVPFGRLTRQRKKWRDGNHPGSHLWDDELGNSLMNSGAFEQREIGDIDVDPAPHPDAIKITMPAGSLMLAKGTLYHRGGANKSDGNRLILTPQYSPGWVRPLENMILSTPPEVAAKLPQRARELIGYSIHPPFMGYVMASIRKKHWTGKLLANRRAQCLI